MIKINTIIEVVGFPREHVDETLDSVLDKLKLEDGIIVLNKKITKAKKIGEMWSAFVELEIETKDLQKLSYFCFNYMPSSIEIIDKGRLDLSVNDVSNVFNDLLSKIHQYNVILKNMQAENVIMKKRLSSQ